VYYNPGVLLSRRVLLLSVAAAAAPKKIVIAGGHPGDPECGCAGTAARLTGRGDQVVLLYLNRGEGYCGGQSLDRCGTVRTQEAANACRILKARPAFAGQYDGRAVVDRDHYSAFAQILRDESPDAVFTHWPIDRHPDHRAISALTLDAWLKSKNSFALYYYEVADDTMMFTPNEYVDISAVENIRHAACYAHASQQPDKWYPKQVEMTRRRGAASGVEQAEGFRRHPESQRFLLP
jgi:LmbE family N-acetylglucosaminyl deacetylase